MGCKREGLDVLRRHREGVVVGCSVPLGLCFGAVPNVPSPRAHPVPPVQRGVRRASLLT